MPLRISSLWPHTFVGPVSGKREFNCCWRSTVFSAYFIATASFSVPRFEKCVKLFDHSCSSYNQSFISNTITRTLLDISLLRRFLPRSEMFISIVLWVMSVQIASLDHKAEVKISSSFPESNSVSDFKSHTALSIRPWLRQRTSV
jgi:hypothetical protein